MSKGLGSGLGHRKAQVGEVARELGHVVVLPVDGKGQQPLGLLQAIWKLSL